MTKPHMSRSNKKQLNTAETTSSQFSMKRQMSTRNHFFLRCKYLTSCTDDYRTIGWSNAIRTAQVVFVITAKCRIKMNNILIYCIYMICRLYGVIDRTVMKTKPIYQGRKIQAPCQPSVRSSANQAQITSNNCTGGTSWWLSPKLCLSHRSNNQGEYMCS